MSAGRISWFGGPNDKTTGPTTASGAPTSTPGIAVYNRNTLGGWWMVKTPNGAVGIVKQTDIGPAPSTGRAVDFTYSSLPLFGYSQQTFPTNGQAAYVWLGKDLTAVSHNLSNALAQIGADPKQQAALITAADAGPLKTGDPFVVGPNGSNPQSAPGVSTKPSGDAQAGGINVPNPLSGLDAIASWLTNATNWLRIGEVIAGIILVAMGLRSLTGSTTTPVSVARSAVKVVK